MKVELFSSFGVEIGMGSKHNGDKRNGKELGEEDTATEDRRQSKRLKLTDSRMFQDLYDDSKSGPPSPVSIINNDERSKPAEVYRKDLISAMKLPDSHTLAVGSFVFLEDQWRQEWERGVQVPVNPEGLQVPSFRPSISQSPRKYKNFKLPSRLITKKGHNSRSKEPSTISYDLDEMDTEWLKFVNRTRHNRGLPEVDELIMEKAISYFENKCYDNMCIALATKRGLTREFDENVCCDVCQSPDVEENNEIIFCDSCDIGVHQACYGVQSIPFGSWLCRPCSRGLSPSCVLCPNKGGAMKKTKDGKQWCHVSCALWIPEVGVGAVEKMEPITRIGSIPASRWNLVCFLCRDKVGACIQCSVKTCITAFHVTCGFEHDLPMRTILDDTATDGVRHVCYCAKHSNRMKSPLKDKSKEKNDQPEENICDKKLREMEEEFYKYVDTDDAVKDLNIAKELATRLHSYWTHKRKVRDDVPLLPPSAEQQERLTGKKGLQNNTDQSSEMERFVLLRQDLERVRNLCYMVNKREKMRRELWRAQERVFRKQVEVMLDDTLDLTQEDMQGIIQSCKGNFFNDDADSADGSSGSNSFLQVLTNASCSLHHGFDSSGNTTSDSSSSNDVRGNQAAQLPNGVLMGKNNLNSTKKRKRSSGFMGKRKRRRKSQHKNSGEMSLTPSHTPVSLCQSPILPDQIPVTPSLQPSVTPDQVPETCEQTALKISQLSQEVDGALDACTNNTSVDKLLQCNGYIHEGLVKGKTDKETKESVPELCVEYKGWQNNSFESEKELENVDKESSEVFLTRRSQRLMHCDDGTGVGNDSSSATESDVEVKEKIHEVRQLRNRLRDPSLSVSSSPRSRNRRNGFIKTNTPKKKESVSDFTKKTPDKRKTFHTRELEKQDKTVSNQPSEKTKPRQVKRSLEFGRNKQRRTLSPYFNKRCVQKKSSSSKESNHSKQNHRQSIQSAITEFLHHEEKLLPVDNECFNSQPNHSSIILTSPERTARMSSLRSSTVSRDENTFTLIENLPPGISNLTESNHTPRRRTRSQTSASVSRCPQTSSRSSSVLNEISHTSRS